MKRAKLFSVVLTTTLSLPLACTKSSEEQPDAKADKSGADDAAAAKAATPETPKEAPEGEPTKGPELAETEAPEPQPTPAAEVEVEPAPAVEVEPGTVPVAPITLTEVSAPWRDAAKPSETLQLVDLQRGVLARGASGHYDISGDGQLVMRPEIEAPPAEILGVWPKDAWAIEERTKTVDHEEIRELRLMRLRGGKRWVPQFFGDEQRFVDTGQKIRKSTSGGMIAWDETMGWIRVADNGDDPDFGVYEGDELVDFLETRAREFYPISKDAAKVYVQTACEDETCVADKTRQLPLGTEWSFDRQIPRQRHSASVLATAGERHFLLHYEAGGWKLEEFPAARADAMWPTKDGGLWARVGAALWHRAPDGGWRKVGLPAGLSDLSVAITEDQKELWIAGTVGGSPAVLATHANAQEPPPEADPPAG